MAKISLAELREKFGPTKNVQPYGDCIIVQGDQFDPDWEAYLAKERARCFFGELDGHPVVFVKPRQQLPPGKSEYVPPSPVVKPVAAEPVKATVPASRKIAKMGPDWSDKEMAELLYQFDLLAAQGKAYGASLLLANSSEFSCRSLPAVKVKLKRLTKMRRDGKLPDSIVQILASRVAADYGHGMEKMSESEPKKKGTHGGCQVKWSFADECELYNLLKYLPKYGRNRVVKKALADGKFAGRSEAGVLIHFSIISTDSVFLKKWADTQPPASEGSPKLQQAEASAAVDAISGNPEQVHLESTVMESAVIPKPGNARYASFYDLWGFAGKSQLAVLKRIEDLYNKSTVVGMDGNILGALVSIFERIISIQGLMADQAEEDRKHIAELESYIKTLQRLLLSHKHAQGSGEMALPATPIKELA